MANEFRIRNGLVVGSDSVDASAIAEFTSTDKGMLVPRMTQAQRDAISTPANGLIIYNNDVDKMEIYNGSAWVSVGSGAGGINFVDNPDIEGGTTGYAAYADAAAATPTDGTGGSPTAAISQNTTTPLRGDADLKLAKDAANRQGEGFSYDFTIDRTDQSDALVISFDYKTTANYVDDDVEVFIYDVTNTALIPVNNGKVKKDTAGTFHQCSFVTASDSTSYRVIWHITSTNANAYDLHVDNVIVGPQETAFTTAMTEPQSWTPTGSWSSNTTYTGKWRRVGDYMHAEVDIALAGAPTSASLTVELPSGYTIDTAKLASGTGTDQKLGEVLISDAGAAFYTGIVKYSDTNTVAIFYEDDAAAGIDIAAVTQAAPITFANTDNLHISFSVPITGWDVNVALNPSILSSDTKSEVRVNAGNGHGSTNNKIRRFSTTDVNTGTAITYADSAANGASFTINEDGVYTIHYGDSHSSSASFGISVNSSALTTSILSLTYATGYRAYSTMNTNNGLDVCSVTLYLSAGDIVRPHTDGTLTGTSALQYFHIIKADTPVIKQKALVPEVITQHEVVVDTGAGFGSTATKVRRIETERVNTGTAITVAHSAANGTSFTINEAGIYALSYQEVDNSGVTRFYITKNVSDLTSAPSATDVMAESITETSDIASCSTTRYLSAGDVVYPMGDGGTSSTSGSIRFSIVKIGPY